MPTQALFDADQIGGIDEAARWVEGIVRVAPDRRLALDDRPDDDLVRGPGELFEAIDPDDAGRERTAVVAGGSGRCRRRARSRGSGRGDIPRLSLERCPLCPTADESEHGGEGKGIDDPACGHD